MYARSWAAVTVIAALAACAAAQTIASHPATASQSAAASQPASRGLETRKPAEFFVSPHGKPTAAGTKADPWDIFSALDGTHKNQIQGGDTIWIQGGVYYCEPDDQGKRPIFKIGLAGTAAKPIIIRTARGQRAILDGTVAVEKPSDYLWLWDLEICPAPDAKAVYETNQSGPWPTELSSAGGSLIISAGRNCRYINLYIHDNPAGGCDFWVGAITASCTAA